MWRSAIFWYWKYYSEDKAMRPLLDCLFVIMYASVSVMANEESIGNTTERPAKDKSSDKDDVQISVYRAIFKQKRGEQTLAAESILKLNDYSKQYKMVEIVLEKLFTVLQDAKVKVTASSYIPGQAFPTEKSELEALANVLENTALFGDILLRLPDVTYKVYTKSKDWELLARWSLSFCNETQIYDETDSKLLYLGGYNSIHWINRYPEESAVYFGTLIHRTAIYPLDSVIRSLNNQGLDYRTPIFRMAQELRLVPRDPNYINPYRNVGNKESLKDAESKEQTLKKKKKEKKKKRGPRLSHAEL